MIDFPWSRGSSNDSGAEPTEEHLDAAVVCEFQDGALAVYDDYVTITRVDRSNFDNREIPVEEITGVDYNGGITIGYIQIEQIDVPVESGGLLSDPVNPNTLHFDRGGRECAKKARDAILERARG
ncbi:hypothetical protein Harman_24220 [Haloarcula mannanilytica]|uniref:Uncharacterized protein n=1 Tax=Haloarcula mannanilytica TaxID=2509225 RepID=A0A4C2ELE0_9EURY|nr:hypothetical protein [Haloarcula mannanilytica]GCF14487.1 hypothetical protein Harman_24220 [Haloarcula mannanilytica]